MKPITMFVIVMLLGLSGYIEVSRADEDVRTLNIDHIPEGNAVYLMHRNEIIVVLKRSDEDVKLLERVNMARVRSVNGCSECDPVFRSINRSIFVASAVSIDSGCRLIYVSSTAKDWDGYWVHGRGGFVDECTLAEYDLAGYPVGNSRESQPIPVPRYKFVSSNEIALE